MEDTQLQDRRRIQINWTAVATIASTLVLVGGMIMTWATNSVRIVNLESRVSTIEQTYVPKSINDEREKAHAAHDEDMERRLERIENKLDQLNKRERGR